MLSKEATDRSILIVSSSERFDAVVKKPLRGYVTIDIRKSAALARRCIMERTYDIVAICAPLPDETGEELALDIADRWSSSVLFAAPQETYEDVAQNLTRRGIMVLSHVQAMESMTRAIDYLTAVQGRMKELEWRALTAEQKADELRIVSKAKLVLVEKKHMTEEEAHRLIGKTAMNNGISRRLAAERILDEW